MTPTLTARNSTGVTRSIGAGPNPCARERTNAPIQSTSPASAVTPSSEKATTAAHQAHPRRRTSPSATRASPAAATRTTGRSAIHTTPSSSI
jgi:hypothetical protein